MRTGARALRHEPARQGFAVPASIIRARFSPGGNHRSLAKTRTPNSRARNTDVSAVPHPRSSTRSFPLSDNRSVSDSMSHSGWGPISLSAIHSAAYPALRGKRASWSSTCHVSGTRAGFILASRDRQPFSIEPCTEDRLLHALERHPARGSSVSRAGQSRRTPSAGGHRR